ncbi:hypothetical protein KDK_53170 [Dictyobacter kobayashii]|uniref:Uncharacterized protein n=1 Tax=Dictyobacter kobayashii TaxID=2014872 RepID=A0A402AR00_9CHLR|nr:hypothetical protein KDK_53170 [Dictyobacter kobayashii]
MLQMFLDRKKMRHYTMAIVVIFYYSILVKEFIAYFSSNIDEFSTKSHTGTRLVP